MNMDKKIVKVDDSLSESKNSFEFEDQFLDKLEVVKKGMSQHGNLFQLKLLMLVLWRAADNKYDQFRLATEFSEAEKFDDVMFQYRKDQMSKWKLRLLQVKHKESSGEKSSSKAEKIQGIFGYEDGDFSLQKYFRSYLKIKRRTEEVSPYSIFSKNEIEDVIIVTNADFNVLDRKYFDKIDLAMDEIFKLGEEKEKKFKNAAIYKPSKDSGILEKCKPIFESTSDYYTLIEILVEGIIKGEINRKKENLLKEYYYPLTKSLLEIQRDSKRCSVKLTWKNDIPFINDLVEEIAFVMLFDGKRIKMSTNFGSKKFIHKSQNSVGDNLVEGIQTLEELAENVADAVKNERELDVSLFTNFQKFIEEFIDVKNEAFQPIFIYGNLKGNRKLSDDTKRFRRTFIKRLLTEEQKQQVQKEFEGKELKFFEKFTSKYIPVETSIFKDIKEFPEQLKKLIFDNRKSRIIKINKDTPQSIRENLQILSGYLIAEQFGKIRFCSSFLHSNRLPDSLNQFREELTALLKDDFKKIYLYEFKIEGIDFKTCEDGALETELPDLHNSDDVLEFFDKLKFIVNYPNRMEINDLLERNIRNKFKILDGKAFNSMYIEGMHDWMANSIGTFLMPQDANQMFKDISNNLSLWTMDGITKSFLADVRSELQFRKCKSFIEFLSSENQVLVIASRHLQLTRVSIVQTFLNLQRNDSEGFRKYTRGFGHIFFYLKQFANLQFRSHISDQIENNTELNLIVIECNAGEENSELCEQFFDLVTANEEIKVLLFTTDKSLIEQVPDILKETSTDKCHFKNLDKESKLKCLSEKITFQGQKATFNDILGNNKTGNVICPDILYRMIEKKDVSIGCTPPLSKGYDEVYYIERHIHTKIYVDLKILTNEDDSVVVNEKEEEFIERCAQFPTKNVHWFKKERIKLSSKYSDVLAWQKTKGAISNVLKYRIYEYVWNKESVEETDILNDKNDIVIISDLAGMGKSTLLSSLTIKMKDRFPDHWLFRIDLNDCTTVLSEELETKKFNRNDLDWAKDLLKRMLACSPYTKLDTKQEEKLFLHSLSFTKKIILLLDAVDEISPNYTKIIIELIQALRNIKLEKTVITTRPNVAKELEKQLNVFSYSLETISEDNQRMFLTKFWRKIFLENNSQSYNENIEDRLRMYSESLIKKLSTLLDDEQRSFTGIPLQLMMMAEIFQNVDNEQEYEGCFQFLASNETEPKLPDKLNLHDLYSMFVKEKYRIYSEEKKNDLRSNLGVEEDNEMLHKMYQEYHRTLALSAFFEDADLKKLLDLSDESIVGKIEHLIKNIEDGKERRGIIDQVINNKPKFIHRTFMEYFVAEFVVDAILNHKNNKKRAEFIIKSIFYHGDRIVIRSFINNLFLKKRLVECEFYGGVVDSIWQREGYRGVDILETACEENNQEIVRFILSSLKNYSSCRTDLFSNLDLKFVAKNLTILKILVENDFDLCTAEDDEKWTILHYACNAHSPDIILIQWLLNQKCINVDLRDNSDRTPLHITIHNKSENSLEILKILLGHRADVNDRSKYGSQPLHEAASRGRIDLAKYLLERGADINCVCYYGGTLLHYAASSGQREFCEWLLNDHKAEVNSITTDGQTPLYWAIGNEKAEVTKLLVEHGANVKACDHNGSQPLHEAASRGRIDLAKYLIERGADVNCVNYNGSTLLHCAAKSERIEFCEWLLNDHKAEVNSKRTNGQTPLHLAVQMEGAEVTKLLVEHGADVNACDENGSQPVHEAAFKGNIKSAKYLIERGADVNCVTSNGSTLLHYVAKSQIIFCYGSLLNDHKEEKTKDCEIPLHLADETEKTEVTKMLLEHGADIDTRDIHGYQPLDEAASESTMDSDLIERDADVSCTSSFCSILDGPVYSPQLEFCKWLINDHKAEVNSKTTNGQTPLHLAVQMGGDEVIKLLVEHGADVNASDENGSQPLHVAASQGRIDLAKYLIERGADVNCVTLNGSTLLHYVAKSEIIYNVSLLNDHKSDADESCMSFDNDTDDAIYSTQLLLEFCKWLINDHKVEVNPRNDDGDTPLHLAVKEEQTEMTKMLLEPGGKMYPLTAPDHDYVKFILRSHSELFAPLTCDNFGEILNFEEINWDGTVDLIEFLKSAADTLRNNQE